MKEIGPDGVPIEIPSVTPFSVEEQKQQNRSENDETLQTDSLFSESPDGVSTDSVEPPTKPAKEDVGTPPEEPLTVPVRQAVAAKAEKNSISFNENDYLNNPISGWIVIVDGPGKGNVMQLFYGKNSIGRDVSQTIALDFGDATISRHNHCYIEYDARDRAFYLLQGEGKNTPRINAQRMHAFSVELQQNSIIELGDTKLHFVAFCGKSFCWDDVDSGKGK